MQITSKQTVVSYDNDEATALDEMFSELTQHYSSMVIKNPEDEGYYREKQRKISALHSKLREAAMISAEEEQQRKRKAG